jgi:DNA repair protein RadC
MNDRIPLYKLKLVRDRWAICPTFSPGQPQLVALFFHRLIGQADREHAAALFLNTHGKPTGASILGIGSLTTVPMPGREIFKAALLANACSLILAHNHPSGSAQPSPQDIRLTRLLIAAGELLGIRVLDHLIVTPGDDFCSLWEAGLLSVPTFDSGDNFINSKRLTAHLENLYHPHDTARTAQTHSAEGGDAQKKGNTS